MKEFGFYFKSSGELLKDFKQDRVKVRWAFSERLLYLGMEEAQEGGMKTGQWQRPDKRF